jgi:hypothetical protein
VSLSKLTTASSRQKHAMSFLLNTGIIDFTANFTVRQKLYDNLRLCLLDLVL